MAIPTFNSFLVGSGVSAHGAKARIVVVGRPPLGHLTPDEAMNLAVWLYVLASLEEGAPTKEDFDAAVKAALES